MLYDIYLDELFYWREEEKELFNVVNYDFFKDHSFIEYSKREKLNFKNGKVTVMSKEKDLCEFIKTSRNIFSSNLKLYFGKISDELNQRIKVRSRISIKNYNLSLQMHVVKHIYKRHGNPFKEMAVGQIEVRDNDFSLIPYLVSNFDSVRLSGVTGNNNKVIVFKKLIQNHYYYLVTYVSHKSHSLEIKTMYKRKKNSATV